MNSNIFVISVLCLVQILFGINYVVSKVIVQAVPPLIWASARIAIASISMFAIAFVFRRNKFPKSSEHFFGPLIIFSLLGIIINQGSFLVGLRHTTSTNSAILNSLIPIFTLLIVTLRGHETLTAKRGIGFILAFSGVLIMQKFESFSESKETLLGDLLTIVNCLSYAIFLSYAKTFLETHDRVWTTTWMFIYGTVGLGLIASPDWAVAQKPEFTPELIACMIYGILGGTLATYFLNMWVLARAKPSSVAMFIYLQPIVASLLAWVCFGEVISLRNSLAAGLIFIGMFVSTQKLEPIGVRST